MGTTKKQVHPAVPPTPIVMPPFIEGMFFALKQLSEVLDDRRRGMHRLEAALRSAPLEDQRLISDVLEPLAGGVQDNVLATVKRRLEDRLMAEAQRRMEPSPAAREGGE